MSLSAQGTRLNRRGVETRNAILLTAVSTLAAGGPEAVSANAVAKAAGVTWGTIQHQFGDADGVWSAVLDHVSAEIAKAPALRTRRASSLARQIAVVVEWTWTSLDSPSARAVQNLRLALPRDPATFERDYPNTAAALRRIDEAWAAYLSTMLDGLVASRAKLRRVQHLLPAALHGIHMQSRLSSLSDPDDARRCLADALVAYLDD